MVFGQFFPIKWEALILSFHSVSFIIYCYLSAPTALPYAPNINELETRTKTKWWLATH